MWASCEARPLSFRATQFTSNEKRPKRNNSKKYFKKLAFFSSPQNSRQLTTIHHESTTTSPQKTTPKTAHFPKPPSKTPANRQKKAPATAGTFSYKIKQIKR
jgi:hypothetical protein